MRRVLLYLVKDRNYSIKEAAIKLNMNYSTAKTILQLFRRTGRIDKIDKQELLGMGITEECGPSAGIMTCDAFAMN